MKKQFLLSLGLAPVAAMAFQIGAWVGGPGQYPQPTKENVQAFQDLQGYHLDLISQFIIFDVNDWEHTKQYADVAKENGSTLVITWMPNGHTAQGIVDGDADDYIRDYAKGIKSYGEELWLRPLHEANGDWYDWGVGKAGAGNTDANVAEAFRHIVNIFREENVTNVKWVWTTNASNQGSGTTFTGNYPGDDYVDYISIDGYNWGKSQDWSNWQSFKQVFRASYKALENINKPLFIAEISSSELGGDKAAWITDMFEQFKGEFSRVFAVMWFSQSKDYEGDWALNTSDAAVEAWKAGVASMLGSDVQSSSSLQNVTQSSSSEQSAVNPQSSSSENSMGVTAAETVHQKMSLRDGKVYMQLDHALRASVVQMDYMGRILWKSPVQNFSAGEHEVDLPQRNVRSLVRLVIQ